MSPPIDELPQEADPFIRSHFALGSSNFAGIEIHIECAASNAKADPIGQFILATKAFTRFDFVDGRFH